MERATAGVVVVVALLASACFATTGEEGEARDGSVDEAMRAPGRDAGRDAAGPEGAAGSDVAGSRDVEPQRDVGAAPDGCTFERCNGADDDCDGLVDEGGGDICADELPNAESRCADSSIGPVCIVLRCLEGFANCDGELGNGCEPFCSCNACADGAALCDDALRDGTESDVDCGGDDCPGCAPGARCERPQDCDSGRCENGACLPPLGCADLPERTGAELHDDALAVLTAESPCGFASCHSGRGKADLVLAGASDLRPMLVDVPACENPGMPRVDSHGGAQALDNSWLWKKLTAHIDGVAALTPYPTWSDPLQCGQLPTTPYGVRMPNGSFDTLPADRLDPIRAWICGGAPGP